MVLSVSTLTRLCYPSIYYSFSVLQITTNQDHYLQNHYNKQAIKQATLYPRYNKLPLRKLQVFTFVRFMVL